MQYIYQAIKGMNDILPPDSEYWQELESKLYFWLKLYGYKNIRTPILEKKALFTHAIGDNTDVIQKEMYSFIDVLNGDELALRPEGTASVLRAVIEHNMLYHKTQKLWYMGAMFRHEKPQKGRYRQFHQLGVESFGYKGAEAEAELIAMLHHLWKILNLSDRLVLEINCLGNSFERQNHRNALIEFLKQHIDNIPNELLSRMHSNPLRLFDTKNEKLKQILLNAPKIYDFLGDESLEHFHTLKDFLLILKIPFKENHNLVRGLDYYNLTVFEWINSDDNLTIAAGGRYDPLVTNHYGSDNYGVGFAIGLERLISILPIKETKVKRTGIHILTHSNNKEIYCYALLIAQNLRFSNLEVRFDFNSSTLKTQLKNADLAKAKFVIIIGNDELSKQTILIKNLENNIQTELNFQEYLQYFSNQSHQ